MDSQTNSILFLTDESDSPARIGLDVTAGGVHYYLIRLSLAPHETRAIDLRALRDSQVPDFKGNKIPAGATDGSVSWIRLDSVPVEGRMMVIQKQQGMASSYDCTTCSCPAGFNGLTVTPGSFGLIPGAYQNMGSTGTYFSCNGGSTYYYTVTAGSSWSSNNTPVIQMDSSVHYRADAMAVGTANVTGTYTDCSQYDSNPDFPDCPCIGYRTSSASGAGLTYTTIQHNYPTNPFGAKGCWISQFFDHVSPATGRAHRAEDVVDSNGKGGGVDPSLGDPVYAAEGGTVVAAPSTFGPASPPYPNCGSHDANYVKIKGSDNYYTVYIHVKPSVSDGQTVNAGQQIGTVDNSGCESGPHVHVQREDANFNRYNFTLPCTNPTPKNNFWDGLVDDIDNDY